MSVPVLTHRRDLRKGDLVFPEEILPIGHMLDVQLDCVGKEVQQEVFGPELDPSPLCDWLNLHTAYDFALQDVVDHIEITLCRNFGEEESTHSRIRSTGRSGTSCAGRWRPAASSVPVAH